MTAAELRAQALPSLLAGPSKRPLALGSLTTLQALSLTGQALRFGGPPLVTEFVLEENIADQRFPVAEPWRRPLVRLLTGKKGAVPESDPLAFAVALELDRLHLRLHPFDLPRLEAFVMAYADRLGPQAQAWSQRDTPPVEKHGYFEADALTDLTWQQAPFPAKARFIEGRRRLDPSGARSLIEAAWSGEQAEGRFRLLKAFQVGLNLEDTPFLESLGTDRAPKVRNLAQRLLSRLGRPGSSPGLQDCLDRIVKTQGGLLKKHVVLSLKPPATVTDQTLPGWIAETFSEVGIEDLARALELSPTSMIEAAQKDENLLFAFFLVATGDGRLNWVKQILSLGLSQAWEVLGSLPPLDLGAWDGADRVRWADLVVQPSSWDQPSSLGSLAKLQRLLGSGISDGLMTAVLGSKAWGALTRDKENAPSDSLEVLAAVCPAGQRSSFRAVLESFPPAQAHRALLFLEIFSALEAPR